MLANDIPMTFLHVHAKKTGVGAHNSSVSVYHSSFHGGVCVLCSPPQSADLALRSDISKLYCTGLKIDPFRNRWAYIAVFGLILKWKSHAIA